LKVRVQILDGIRAPRSVLFSFSRLGSWKSNSPRTMAFKVAAEITITEEDKKSK
jgi:hypothetical protein